MPRLRGLNSINFASFYVLCELLIFSVSTFIQRLEALYRCTYPGHPLRIQCIFNVHYTRAAANFLRVSSRQFSRDSEVNFHRIPNAESKRRFEPNSWLGKIYGLSHNGFLIAGL